LVNGVGSVMIRVVVLEVKDEEEEEEENINLLCYSC